MTTKNDIANVLGQVRTAQDALRGGDIGSTKQALNKAEDMLKEIFQNELAKEKNTAVLQAALEIALVSLADGEEGVGILQRLHGEGHK